MAVGGGQADTRLPAHTLTKAEYDRWVGNTNRPYTDPWMSLHRHSRNKTEHEAQKSAKGRKD